MRVSASADWPRPYVGVCGSMHGNEPCGALAVQRIAGDFESRALLPEKGTLFLIHANLEATSLGLRHTPEGEDLNRLWDFEFTRTLREEAWGYEHRRALELKELLGELDILLDLHSAGTSTPPFGVSNGEGSVDELAKQIGISYLVQSWYGLADKVIIGFLKLAGVPALSVECGAHGDPDISETAYRIALSFLRATGAIDDGRRPSSKRSTNGSCSRNDHQAKRGLWFRIPVERIPGAGARRSTRTGSSHGDPHEQALLRRVAKRKRRDRRRRDLPGRRQLTLALALARTLALGE